MTLNAQTIYTKLHPYFQRRLRLNEPLARHSTFGVGGPADVWVSVNTSRELFDLVSMCVEEQWPLLLVGNGTNVLFADAGVRGIVARIVLDYYTVEDQGDNTALLEAGAGVS